MRKNRPFNQHNIHNVSIITLGCKLNQYEGRAIAEALQKRGFQVTGDSDSADAVIVNSCTVTNKADAKSRQAIKRAKRAGKFVIAVGCLANTDSDEIDALAEVDLTVLQKDKFRIAEILQAQSASTLPIDFPEVHHFDRTRGTVKIQDGCDRFCSYCKVPFARGRSRSVSPDDAVRHAGKLLENGYRELVLTGVNISDYRKDGLSLAGLASRILELPWDFRLRFSSIQPDQFNAQLLALLDHPRFAPHFHLSLQSGSTEVLKRMNRHYSSSEFLDIVRAIRDKRQDAGVSTDIIVGFPGESDAEFEESLSLVRQAEFSRTHIFRFSPRAGTKAAAMKDLNGNLKREREKRLRQAAEEATTEFVKKRILGTTYRVLIETVDNGIATGYTGNYLKVELEGQDYVENSFVDFIPKAYRIESDSTLVLR